MNLIGCIYLARHNFEVRASSAIPTDRGVFVVSGRTAAHRTCILQDENFPDSFTNEMFLFGLLGLLNCDDDNFITRWNLKHDWDIRIQYSKDSIIETTIGTVSGQVKKD
jgi:hypothetical protein